jgi:hypothetical protein
MADLRPHGVLPERPTGPRGLRRDGCRTAGTMTLAIEDDVATDLRLLRAYERWSATTTGAVLPDERRGLPAGMRPPGRVVGTRPRGDSSRSASSRQNASRRRPRAPARRSICGSSSVPWRRSSSPGSAQPSRSAGVPCAGRSGEGRVVRAPGRRGLLGLPAAARTVPGGTAAAAQVKYARAREDDQRLVYYGARRAVRAAGSCSSTSTSTS